jgi:rhamnogalacturonyl hydrolase YesR
MRYITTLIAYFILSSCTSVYNDGYVAYAPVKLTEEEKQTVRRTVEELEERYDPERKMLTSKLNGWNYHTDATSGTFHHVRGSFEYALALLDLDDAQYRQQAFDIIEKTISLQDADTTSKSCGVWPYFEEEPLATKKSPIDYNWADFNAVTLLDIYTGHKDKLPPALSKKIEEAIVLAAKSIQKRNIGPDYTNIAIMGAYVTYFVSHLFDIPDMQSYAAARLQRFYNYTLEKNGFSEYNSPAYTIVALNELDRMKRHIVEPKAKGMVDSLYTIGWDIIAKHFHRPTAQWAGPHNRSYSTPVSPSFYGLLYGASDGKIDLGYKDERRDVRIKHHIPAHLLPYFLSPVYPRLQRDTFENNEPQITGTCYLADRYALSSANKSSLWNQRRPFLAYWGTADRPSYLQVRFLHDLYDFSAATYFSEQKENAILSGINFATNGGDKHVNIDILKEGKFKARDLRLRFEFGNTDAGKLSVPAKNDAPVTFTVDSLQFNIRLFYALFDTYKGYWEKGGDGKNGWIDFVLYSGDETDIDLTAIDTAALGFTFRIAPADATCPEEPVAYSVNEGMLSAEWSGLSIALPVKPEKIPNRGKRYFSAFPKGSTPREVGAKLSRRFIPGKHMLHGDKWIHYAEVCTWYGALRFAEAAGDKELVKELQERFEPLFSSEKAYRPVMNHVDLNMFGCLPLEFYRITKDRRYYDLGLPYADTQWALPDSATAEEKQWAGKGLSWQTRMWIDDMFMITIIQSQAYKATGKEEYINRAAREMAVYLDSLQRPNGLFFHAPDVPFFWGRGNGWMAAGMAELLRTLPVGNPDRPRILKGYREMMKSLKSFRTEKGLWNQLVDDPACWTETSGSAMFAYAMITGVKQGWLNAEEYAPVARKAWLALVPYINAESDVTEVCVGTNKKNDRQYYYDRPRIAGDYHGQAPMLWCAFALLDN